MQDTNLLETQSNKSPQEINAAYLNALWLGPALFDRQLQQFTRIVERCEKAAYLPPCECVDSTGYYQCNQPSTVGVIDGEFVCCLRCFKEIV